MTFQDIITTIGIPAILGTSIYIGRKLQVLDGVEKKVESMYDRFIRVEEQVNTLLKDEFAPANSPRQLNKRGNDLLTESGIRGVIDSKKQDLFEAVKKIKPTNSYDAEQVILSVVHDLPKHCPDVIPQLKDAAFKTGQSIDTVLLVGGFYLRDLIFSDLGFSLIELDTPKNT
jgi:hypothetical protein